MASQEEPCLPLSSFRELGRTGIKVSPIGFGGGPLGNEFGEQDVRVTKTCFSSLSYRSLAHSDFTHKCLL